MEGIGGDANRVRNVIQKESLIQEASGMTRLYSNDLRERVVRAHLAGEPIRAVAARFGVSVSSVPKWVACYRAAPPCSPGPG